jgi:hypothetical protein
MIRIYAPPMLARRRLFAFCGDVAAMVHLKVLRYRSRPKFIGQSMWSAIFRLTILAYSKLPVPIFRRLVSPYPAAVIGNSDFAQKLLNFSIGHGA